MNHNLIDSNAPGPLVTTAAQKALPAGRPRFQTLVWVLAIAVLAAGMACLAALAWVSFHSVAVVEDQVEWVAHVQKLILGSAFASALLMAAGSSLLVRAILPESRPSKISSTRLSEESVAAQNPSNVGCEAVG
jgi:hypothetical protein